MLTQDAHIAAAMASHAWHCGSMRRRRRGARGGPAAQRRARPALAGSRQRGPPPYASSRAARVATRVALMCTDDTQGVDRALNLKQLHSLTRDDIKGNSLPRHWKSWRWRWPQAPTA